MLTMGIHAKLNFKTLAIIGALLCSMNTYSKQKTTTFACSYFPPFKIQGDGDHMGIDVDIISEVFKAIGKKNKYKFLPWKRALVSVKSGELDALCGCSYLKSREDNFIYTNEIGKNLIGVFTLHKSKFIVKSIKDLKDRKIAVVRGYSLENELRSSDAKVIPVKDESQLIRLLKSKRVDAIYSFKTPINYILNKDKIQKNLKFQELRSSPYYTCFNKSSGTNRELVKEFNLGLNKIKSDGTYMRILKKYLEN